jgi:two-component system cell cycle sensor histidine kinase/response regulator CckA
MGDAQGRDALALAEARIARLEERARVLAETTRELAHATSDYASLLDLLAKRLGERVGELCVIRLLTSDGEWLEAAGVYHPDEAIARESRRVILPMLLRPGEGMTGQVAATGKALLAPVLDPVEVAKSVDPKIRSFIERLEIRSLIAAPLVSRGERIGVVTLIRARGPSYTADDLSLVEELCGHAALAIVNARLFEASKVELAERTALAERLRFISDCNRDFTAATADLVRLLGVIARRLAVTVGDMCAVYLVSEDGQWLETAGGRAHRDPDAQEAWSRPDEQNTRVRVGETFSGRIAATGTSMILSREMLGAFLSRATPEQRAYMERLDIACLMGAPLVAESKTIGVIAMARTSASAPYSDDDLRLLEDVAAQASLAVANSRLVGSLRRELADRERAEAALRGTEEQLRQAQKMEAVGRLAGGVAHDFNNLLSVVLTYSSLLADELAEGDPRRDDVLEIVTAGKRAADLTKQLLAFSRRQVIEPRVLSLSEIVAGMDKMLRRLVGEDVELRTSGARAEGRIKADPGHLEQVVMNLVVNARDAMPHGGQLTIETRDVELDDAYAAVHHGVTPGPHVMLAISDTGTGMSRDTQERIFEPFFTTKEHGKGTGLGLATVFGIVRQSGGSIFVYSELGRGSTFKLYFPRSDEPMAARAAPVRIETLRGTETILLVEDEEQLRTVATTVLVRNGYRVLPAARPEEALALAAAHDGPIALLLTDVVMPGMSGRDLARRVTASLPSLRVLYMSGYTDDAIVHHGVLDPGVSLLQKPITPDALLRRVREIIDGPAAV